MKRNFIVEIKNHLLQLLALFLPGGKSVRVFLHRMRGVKIGKGTWIGLDTLIDTSKPHLVTIGENVVINIRVMILAHFRGREGVTIEDEVFIGSGAIILSGVTIGRGAVVAAGSVVNKSVAPMTMVQGNPAKPIATCGVSLRMGTPYKEFLAKKKPIHVDPDLNEEQE